jgi:hypothetical protein
MSHKADNFNTSNITVLNYPDKIYEWTLTHLPTFPQKVEQIAIHYYH